MDSHILPLPSLVYIISVSTISGIFTLLQVMTKPITLPILCLPQLGKAQVDFKYDLRRKN